MGNTISKYSVFEKCLIELNVQLFRCPFNDHGAKKLLSGQAIALMVEAQLHQRETLDDISENLKSNSGFRSFLNLGQIHASTIYRKLEKLPTEYLKELYLSLTQRITKIHRNSQLLPDIGLLHIIDSTEIKLPERSKWAYCSSTKNGIKIHTRLAFYNEETTYPDRIVNSTAAVSDQETTEYLVTDPEATYVFDRGYINYKHYYEWLQKRISFVARVKANSRVTKIEARSVSSESNVTNDCDVEVKIPHTEITFKLRLVEFKDDQNQSYRILTNRWDLTSQDVAQIYKFRWKIELFFKWMKQHLIAVKWFNHKPEAVWNQIYLILIAYALCEWMRLLTESSISNWELLRKLRHNWWNSWSDFIDDLLSPSTRTSKGRRKKGKPGRPRKHPKVYKAVKIIQF